MTDITPTDEALAAAEARDTTSPPTTVAEVPAPAKQESANAGIEVFKEVPGFDERTLVLKKGEQLLDLQFCACVNKYKKRFSQFLKENGEFYDLVKEAAVSLSEQGYKDFDVRELLDYLKTHAKLTVPAAEYILRHPHDFALDTLPRAYLVRKLMMEEPKLFGFFHLDPVKCRSNCGYPSDEAPQEDKSSTDIAGF